MLCITDFYYNAISPEASLSLVRSLTIISNNTINYSKICILLDYVL